MRRAALVVAGGAAVLGWGEWQHRRWSRSAVGDPVGRTEAVVVLGFRNRGDRANLVNRWRVRAGLRSIDPDRESRLVLSGGPVGSAVPEARVYLRRQRPDLAARLAPGRDHVVGEWLLAKPVLAVHGVLSLRAVRAAER